MKVVFDVNGVNKVKMIYDQYSVCYLEVGVTPMNNVNNLMLVDSKDSKDSKDSGVSSGV